nr:bursicon-A1 [Urechis unicinctus]
MPRFLVTMQTYIFLVIMTLTQGQTFVPEVSPSSDLQESCKVRRIIHRVDYQGCLPRRMVSLACQGTCRSYTQVSAGQQHVRLERHCSCCQEVQTVTRNATIRCRNDRPYRGRPFKTVVLRLTLPVRCMCRPCSAGVGIVPLELAGIDDKRNLWTAKWMK